MNRNYRVIIRKEPEGTYTAMVPTLLGCITWGETIEEAIAMTKEAIEVMLESMEARNLTIPDDTDTLEYSISITPPLALVS